MFYIALIFAGGTGALLRYLIGRLTLNLAWVSMPFGTLIANLLGCFLMGYLSWLMVHRWQLSYEFQAVVLSGFLGGFTTFSAFSIETVNLIQQGMVIKAMVYVGTSVILCVLMCLLGLFIAKHI